MEDIVISSPNSVHKAKLKNIGEIRFGPPYYSLMVNKLFFDDHVFGDSCLWSPDSQYFAVQEWETTSEVRGPQTRLILIDVKQKRECILSRAEHGFIIPKRFEDQKLIYTKEYPEQGIVKEFEIEFLNLNRWKNLK